MHIKFIQAIIGCCLIAAGCSREAGETAPGVFSKAKELSDSALHIIHCGGSFGDAAAVQEQAIAELRAHGSPHGVDILAEAGYLYCRMGDYVRGLAYLQEANDSLNIRPGAEGAIKLKGNLANLYSRLGLYDESLVTNREGYAMALKSDSTLASDFLRFRANTFIQLNQPDSVLACYREAFRLADCKSSVYSADAMAMVMTDKASFLIDHYKEYPDSVVPILAVLPNIPDTVGSNGMKELYLGRGYFLAGRLQEGLARMRHALDLYTARDDWEMVAFIQRMLLQSYAEQGMGHEMPELFLEYAALNDSLTDRAKHNAILGAEFRYQTSLKEEQLKALSKINSLHRQTIFYQWFAIAVSIIIIVIGVIAAVRYVKRMRRARAADSERINRHIAKEESMQSLIADLDSQIKQLDSKENIQEITSRLDSSLLCDKGEQTFRRSFAILYPRFLMRLREICPQLTSSNEIVCMLIYLHQSNEEIAQCLGITRMSVNSARYLIRKKLGLDKNVDLNAYIRSIGSDSQSEN